MYIKYPTPPTTAIIKAIFIKNHNTETTPDINPKTKLTINAPTKKQQAYNDKLDQYKEEVGVKEHKDRL